MKIKIKVSGKTLNIHLKNVIEVPVSKTISNVYELTDRELSKLKGSKTLPKRVIKDLKEEESK